MKITHSLVVFKDGKIVHYCGYPSKPSKTDIESLKEELPNFGITGNIIIEDGPQELSYWINTLQK